jgi:hypothetical protein
VSTPLRLCQSVPVLVSRLRPDTALIGRRHRPGGHVAPARRGDSNPAAADFLSNAQRLKGRWIAPQVRGADISSVASTVTPYGLSPRGQGRLDHLGALDASLGPTPHARGQRAFVRAADDAPGAIPARMGQRPVARRLRDHVGAIPAGAGPT